MRTNGKCKMEEVHISKHAPTSITLNYFLTEVPHGIFSISPTHKFGVTNHNFGFAFFRL